MAITHNLPMPDYLSLNALSSGVAFEAVTRSPFHAKYKQQTTDRWSKRADLGTLVHQILLEHNENCVVWIDASDFRTKVAQTARDEAYADGKTPMLLGNRDEVYRMVNAVREQLEGTELARVFGKGNAEVTVEWMDNGIACKARPDYLTDDLYVSVKTTEASVEPVGFTRRMIGPMGYDFGIAFYERGLKANGWSGESRILAIEQKPPYGISVIALAPSKRAIAESMVDRAIPLWAACLEKASFLGYGSETHWAEASSWELAEAEESELTMIATGGKG